jgi:hypothetical protein
MADIAKEAHQLRECVHHLGKCLAQSGSKAVVQPDIPAQQRQGDTPAQHLAGQAFE